MTTSMKRLRAVALAAGLLAIPTSCKDFLDVNENPNAPQEVSANLYLAPMLHWLVTSPQFDGRFIGRYTQNWTLPGTALGTWDRMGYDPSSDNGAQQWRDVYWSLGQNLVDMMTKAEAEERWDLLGVGYVLKAWGWLVLVDMHGPIIIDQAFDQTRFTFDYNTEQEAYAAVDSLLGLAITNLRRTDGAVDAIYMGRTDKIYAGNKDKWRKFAFGLRGMARNHFSNKASYDAAAVIADIDSSFASSADDALLTYSAVQGDFTDYNFWGRSRNNLTSYRQTQFVVNLMNGTAFGGVDDPRKTRMLSPSPDGQYRGLDINVVGFGAMTAAQQPNNFMGYAGTGGLQLPGRFLFDDKAKIPAMTYAQLQFVKAEAAYRANDKPTALTAFRNGVSAHVDWVNARNVDNGQTPTQITAGEKATLMASAAVPSVAANLTMTHIMMQKYIAQFGWGHNEQWMDMRRFHYTDIDPASGVQVFPGFTPPTTLHADNAGKIVQRIRARFNSEYVWNRDALAAIGGLATDYHTVPLWIILP
jgi:hypothetical protein